MQYQNTQMPHHRRGNGRPVRGARGVFRLGPASLGASEGAAGGRLLLPRRQLRRRVLLR